MDDSSRRVDKDDGRSVQNIPVLHPIAHNLTHTSPTDDIDIITTRLLFFGLGEL